MPHVLRRSFRVWVLVALCGAVVTGAQAAEHVDLLIRNGVIYDGRGGEPVRGDVAVRDGKIVAFGKLQDYTAKTSVDAGGMAVAPGFINTLSLATDSLIQDGRVVATDYAPDTGWLEVSAP